MPADDAAGDGVAAEEDATIGQPQPTFKDAVTLSHPITKPTQSMKQQLAAIAAELRLPPWSDDKANEFAMVKQQAMALAEDERRATEMQAVEEETRAKEAEAHDGELDQAFTHKTFKQAVIVACMKDDELEQSRIGALRYICTVASSRPDSVEELWECMDIVQDAVLQSCLANSEDIQILGLAALLVFARPWKQKFQIWQEPRTEDALLKGLRSCEAVVLMTLSVLQSLTVDVDVCRLFWTQRDCVHGLLTSYTGDPQIGRGIVMVMRNLACSGEVARSMWSSDALRQCIFSILQGDTDDAAKRDKDDLKGGIPEDHDSRVLSKKKKANLNYFAIENGVDTRSAADQEKDAQATKSLVLTTLHNLAVDEAVKETMWEEGWVRNLLLESCPSRPPKGQLGKAAITFEKLAMITLQDMAMLEANRPKMWRDEKVFSLVLRMAVDGANDDARGSALSILQCFSACDVVKQSMWDAPHGDTMRRLLLSELRRSSTGNSHIVEDRLCCLACLQNLAPLDPRGTWYWQTDDPLAGPKKDVVDYVFGAEPMLRLGALGVVRNHIVACSEACRRSLWDLQHPVTFKLLRAHVAELVQLQGVEWCQSRELAVGVLAAWAGDESRAAAVWQDPYGFADAILEASSLTHALDRPARTTALAALQALTIDAALAEEIWLTRAVRLAVIAAAGLKEPADRPVRTTALGVMQNMSVITDVAIQMWDDVGGARAVITAAAQLEKRADRKAKSFAFGVLYNVACVHQDRVSFWHDRGVRVPVLAACENEHEDAMIRERALGVVQRTVMGITRLPPPPSSSPSKKAIRPKLKISNGT
jgi:hypothetical protein